MADLISSVIDNKANEQVITLTKQLEELHATAQSIEIRIAAPKDLQELIVLTKQLNDNTDKIKNVTNELAKATLTLQKAETEAIKTKREKNKLNEEILASQEKLNKARDRDIKQAGELVDDYKLLSKAYTDAANKAKNLGVTLGTTHPEFLKAAENANKLRARLTQVEQSVGQFQRQVGNYNIVGMQFNQILRELPNAGISARTFIQSISNNVTFFAESVKDARAQGASWKDILKTMGTSMFGLVGIINLATLALNYFASNTSNSGKEIDAATKSNDEYVKSLQSIDSNAAKSAFNDVARLRVLQETTENAANSQEMRIKAAKELQSLYPELLASYKQEAILNGEAASAINTVADALLARAKAGAAESKIAESANREYELLLEYRQLDLELTKKQKQLRSTNDDTGVTQALLSGDIGALRQKIEANRLLRLQAKAEQDKFVKDVQYFTSQVGSTLNKSNAVGKETIVEKVGKDASIADDKVVMLQRSMKDIIDLANESLDRVPSFTTATVPTPVDKDKKAWDDFYNYIEQKGVQTAGQIFNAFADATKRKSEDEIARLDREKEAIDRNTTFELEKIRNSTLSAQDKEKAIQFAQANSEAQRKQIERQQIESKRRAARADRDASVAQILLNTAEAVIKALTDKTVPYPVRVGYAISAGGIGAAQAAIAKSTPLPQYEDGTLDHIGGKFIAGDGREKELIIEPSGRMYMSRDKSTIYNAPKHTKVLNQDMIMQLSGLFTPQLMKAIEGKRDTHDKKLADRIDYAVDRLGKKIQNNRPIIRNNFNTGLDSYRNMKTNRQ